MRRHRPCRVRMHCRGAKTLWCARKPFVTQNFNVFILDLRNVCALNRNYRTCQCDHVVVRGSLQSRVNVRCGNPAIGCQLKISLPTSC